MKKASLLSGCIIILIMLTNGACSSPSTLTTSAPTEPAPLIPRIINHVKPDLTLDASIFRDIGCTKIPHDELEICDSSSPLAKLGCDEIKQPSSLLGGLTPSYPLALCMERTYDISDTSQSHPNILPESEYIYDYFGDGCIQLPLYVHYVIYRDGQFQLVKTRDEFRNIFAPIDSPEEALSYSLAMGRWSALYDLSLDKKYQYFVAILEDTHVDQLSDGYKINLYEYQACSCGPHWTTEFQVKVTFDGVLEVVNQESVFKDPSEDELCRD